MNVRNPADGEQNADYVSAHAVLELKIFEEEGFEKIERQDKIAALYSEVNSAGAWVDLELNNVPLQIRRQLEAVVAGPLQTAVKKASKQIRASADSLGEARAGVLIAVNNGYSYLDADNFERLLVRRCRNDASAIDHAACITVDYHQGDVDAFVFCAVRCHAVRGVTVWSEFESFQKAVLERFNAAMTEMMRDQMNPALWDAKLMPVTDIRFERHGVTYLRRAPEVPDPRFND